MYADKMNILETHFLDSRLHHGGPSEQSNQYNGGTLTKDNVFVFKSTAFSLSSYRLRKQAVYS